MSDIHALSGAYTVDALDEGQRAEFERHLAGCAECRAEVASFRETTALLAETSAETPPASLRDSVLAGISQVRPLPPVTPEPSTEEKVAPVAPLRRRRLPQILVAAAAVVLLAVGVLAWHPWRNDTTTVADQILNAPDAVRTVEQLPGNAGELTLVRSPSLGKAVMIGNDVRSPGSDKTYQLWYVQPGAGPVSAGLMPDASEPTVLSGDLATAQAAAVSVEPETGSETPTHVVAEFPLKPGSGGNGGT
ncbi:MAG: anti-sigma factor [Nocardioides sp.]|nr:anti-sigma factor [Nocardioides sp.]